MDGDLATEGDLGGACGLRLRLDAQQAGVAAQPRLPPDPVRLHDRAEWKTAFVPWRRLVEDQHVFSAGLRPADEHQAVKNQVLTAETLLGAEAPPPSLLEECFNESMYSHRMEQHDDPLAGNRAAAVPPSSGQPGLVFAPGGACNDHLVLFTERAGGIAPASWRMLGGRVLELAREPGGDCVWARSTAGVSCWRGAQLGQHARPRLAAEAEVPVESTPVSFAPPAATGGRHLLVSEARSAVGAAGDTVVSVWDVAASRQAHQRRVTSSLDARAVAGVCCAPDPASAPAPHCLHGDAMTRLALFRGYRASTGSHLVWQAAEWAQSPAAFWLADGGALRAFDTRCRARPAWRGGGDTGVECLLQPKAPLCALTTLRTGPGPTWPVVATATHVVALDPRVPGRPLDVWRHGHTATPRYFAHLPARREAEGGRGGWEMVLALVSPRDGRATLHAFGGDVPRRVRPAGRLPHPADGCTPSRSLLLPWGRTLASPTPAVRPPPSDGHASPPHPHASPLATSRCALRAMADAVADRWAQRAHAHARTAQWNGLCLAVGADGAGRATVVLDSGSVLRHRLRGSAGRAAGASQGEGEAASEAATSPPPLPTSDIGEAGEGEVAEALARLASGADGAASSGDELAGWTVLAHLGVGSSSKRRRRGARASSPSASTGGEDEEALRSLRRRQQVPPPARYSVAHSAGLAVRGGSVTVDESGGTAQSAQAGTRKRPRTGAEASPSSSSSSSDDEGSEGDGGDASSSSSSDDEGSEGDGGDASSSSSSSAAASPEQLPAARNGPGRSHRHAPLHTPVAAAQDACDLLRLWAAEWGAHDAPREWVDHCHSRLAASQRTLARAFAWRCRFQQTAHGDAPPTAAAPAPDPTPAAAAAAAAAPRSARPGAAPPRLSVHPWSPHAAAASVTTLPRAYRTMLAAASPALVEQAWRATHSGWATRARRDCARVAGLGRRVDPVGATRGLFAAALAAEAGVLSLDPWRAVFDPADAPVVELPGTGIRAHPPGTSRTQGGRRRRKRARAAGDGPRAGHGDRDRELLRLYTAAVTVVALDPVVMGEGGMGTSVGSVEATRLLYAAFGAAHSVLHSLPGTGQAPAGSTTPAIAPAAAAAAAAAATSPARSSAAAATAATPGDAGAARPAPSSRRSSRSAAAARAMVGGRAVHVAGEATLPVWPGLRQRVQALDSFASRDAADHSAGRLVTTAGKLGGGAAPGEGARGEWRAGEGVTAAVRWLAARGPRVVGASTHHSFTMRELLAKLGDTAAGAAPSSGVDTPPPPGPTLTGILLSAALAPSDRELAPHLRPADTAALRAAFRGWTLTVPRDEDEGPVWPDATLLRAEAGCEERPAQAKGAPLWSAASGWRRGAEGTLSAVLGRSRGSRAPVLRVRSTAQALPAAPLVDAGTERVLEQAWTDPGAGAEVAQQFWRRHYETLLGEAQRATIRRRARQQIDFHERYRDRIAKAMEQSQDGRARAPATSADAAMGPPASASGATGQSAAVEAAVRDAMANMMGASQGEEPAQTAAAPGIDLFSQSTLGPASQESAGMFSTQTVDFFSQ